MTPTHTHTETGYGHFCGGDPREFSPDHECSTEAERAKHAVDCAAWERGARPNVNANAPHFVTEHCHIIPAGYGLGGYSVEFECDDPACADYVPDVPHPLSYGADLPMRGVEP